jgi:hypothetical protein
MLRSTFAALSVALFVALIALTGCGRSTRPTGATVDDNTQCFGVLHAQSAALGWGEKAPNAAAGYIAYCKDHHQVQADLGDIDYKMRWEEEGPPSPA